METAKPLKQKKYKEIYNYVFREIQSGTFRPGSKIPTETELARAFKASRPTVSKALRDLQHRGLIYRIQGSGSFVPEITGKENMTLGLLASKEALASDIQHGFSIFSQIIPEISTFSNQRKMALILGNSPYLDQTTFYKETTKCCEDYIQRGVKGVFFLPFETTDETVKLNEMVADKFSKAGIKVILLDRDLTDDPTQRSQYDIVGLDNTRASYILTRHLIEHDCKKILFIARHLHNSVIKDRFFGYRRALWDNNLSSAEMPIVQIEEWSYETVKSQLLSQKADGIVCCNDGIAAFATKAFSEAGIRIPEDIKIAGFDDIPLAAHLLPSLTTIRQPVMSLAREAVLAMMNRIEHPQSDAKDIKIHGELIIRHSCGCETA